MMLFYTIAVLVEFASSQITVDPSILLTIFNTPRPGYSDTITIRLKEGITSYVDSEGRKYACVPHYPYDPNISASEMSDTRVTGCGLIQVRSEDDDDDKCRVLVDSVCTLVMDPVDLKSRQNKVDEPKPPPSSTNEPRPPPSKTNEPRPPPSGTYEPRPLPSETNELRPPPSETNEHRPAPNGNYEPRPPPSQSKPPPTEIHEPKPPSTEIKGCGYRNLKGVVSNNTETQPGEFPWVVALLNSNRQRYVGVGALISPQVVVTTAHVVCRRNRKTSASIRYPNWLKIRAGAWDLSNSKEIYGSQERTVKEVYILNEFNKTNPRHNIALLLFEEPLVLSEHINAICLPEQDEVFDRYKNCVANGWTKDVFDPQSNNSKSLKKVDLEIVPYTRCSTLLKRTRLGSNFKLHSSFICGGGKESRNTCQGDGGAPLACPNGDNQYKLTGLVSWGIGCGQKDIPALYTNVPKYRQWVDARMEAWGLQTSWYKIKDVDDYNYDYNYDYN